MLFRDRLQTALDLAAPHFDRFEAERAGRLEALLDALDSLDRDGPQDLVRAIATHEAPGALPTSEWRQGLRVPFGTTFADHPTARAWALERLRDRSTFAADGSQIEPDPRFSVPVGLVQVGTFENHHRPDAPSYRKDAMVRILGPQDLREDEVGPPKRKVDLARFELEVQALVTYLEAPRDPEGPRRVAFFDGSLVVSFAEKRKQDAFARRYVELVRQLLRASERSRTPLVAFVDTSYAHDLVSMLATWRGLAEPGAMSDGALLMGRLSWGDRTPTSICARPGILDAYGEDQRRIGFCYLQTNSDAPPARLEYPLWLLEEGMLDEVVDVVRAEAIAGAGYPYTLAAADQTAVVTREDREVFYRTFQEFLDRRGVPLRFSKKALSKLRRR